MKRILKTQLSAQSINETINQLKVISQNLEQASNEITKEMVEYTKERIQHHFDSRQNIDEEFYNIDYKVNGEVKGNKGRAFATGSSVIYAEFGTGEVGRKFSSSVRPTEFGLNDYNTGEYVSQLTNEFGEHYWVYDGHYTQGIPAGMFVYKAMNDLKKEKASICKKNVRDALF